jgi:23S rRNA (pseudouridine1915-N3)-methyltransferase
MKIQFIHVGKTADDYLKEGIGIYMKRLMHYAEVTEIIVAASNHKDKIRAIEEESAFIQKKISKGDYIVILDEAGKQFTSRELANNIETLMNRSISSMSFITGGAFGISDTLKKNASLVLSLSTLTFTHQMVRLIVAEQLYRAMTILKKEKYHHD